MRDCNQGRFRQQIRFLRRQFLQDGDLPFCDILSEQIVSQAMTAIETCWLDRIYSAAGHVVGLFRPSAESGSFLSCGRGPFDRSSRFTWTTSLLG